MTTPLKRLRDDLRLSVLYDDHTPFGSVLSGLADALITRTCAPVLEQARRRGRAWLLDNGPQLMARCLAPAALGALYRAPERLREDCLYPDRNQVRPVALNLELPERPRRVHRLSPGEAGRLAAWLGEWNHLSRPPSGPRARALWTALEQAGALTDQPAPRPCLGEGLTFVGHATVAFSRGGSRIVVDPFLLPPDPADPPSYRPLLPGGLAPEAVFITHSHPDHYDPGSLLRLGADLPIFVPAVTRESLLSIDMAARLRELGFTRVRELAWGETVSVGPYRVRALPFYGEQPADREVLHPEVRNLGNTYRVEDGRRSVVLLADAGRDPSGDCRELAGRDRAEGGAVDTVVGGYRAWRLQPVQYLTTSVARYALFIPRTQWDRRLQIMNDAADLLETAARWGARRVIPYANGGAPWYWRRGLGPRLDGEGREDADFDPHLQRVARAGEDRRKAGLDSPAIVALNPGERLRYGPGGNLSRERVPWPYFDHTTLFAPETALEVAP